MSLACMVTMVMMMESDGSCEGSLRALLNMTSALVILDGTLVV